MPPEISSPLAINLAHVSKTYSGNVHALRDVTMQVGQGEIFGLLGPNGAGKSTLVKILTTVIRPSRAEGSLLGRPIGHKPTLARVGYLPEHHRFPDYLTGRQVVDYFGALANTPRAERRKRGEELLDFVGMRDWADQRVSKYSKGMRQRIGIAQALVSNPDLVILDEPTDGVDPVGRREIRDMVRTLKSAGKTVFINSHLLSELELVCDRVAILVKGQVASQGTIDDLTKHRRRYEIDLAAPPEAVAPFAPTVAALGGTLTASTFAVPGDDPATIQPLLDDLRRAGLVIKAVRPYRPSLEDLFMEAVTDRETGKAATPGADRNGGRR